MALAALGVQHFACGSHLEALFRARLGLQLGHLALLIAVEKPAEYGVFPAKMLVRALKVLRFLSQSAKPARSSPRQPLFSRAMQAALMAEQLHFGNDEPSNRLRRLMAGCCMLASSQTSPGQDKMSISAFSFWLF